jgi:hypothetical protein
MVDVIEDQRRIDQHGAVVFEEGRCFDNRIELRKLVEVTKHRHVAMLEGQAKHGQRNRDATHIWRVQHANQ